MQCRHYRSYRSGTNRHRWVCHPDKTPVLIIKHSGTFLPSATFVDYVQRLIISYIVGSYFIWLRGYICCLTKISINDLYLAYYLSQLVS